MRLLPLAMLPLCLALGGCGEMYYQTRYIPESSDASYSAYERATWSGDKEVYELPANPPAIDDLHRSRKDCLPPGQRFKPDPLVGIYSDPDHHETAGVTAMAGSQDAPTPGPKPAKPYPIDGWLEPHVEGAHEPIGLVPVGVSNRGPFPGIGPSTIEAPPIATWRTDQTNWCDVDH